MTDLTILLDERHARLVASSSIRWAAVLDAGRRASAAGAALASAGTTPLRDVVKRHLRAPRGPGGRTRRAATGEAAALHEIVARLARDPFASSSPGSSSRAPSSLASSPSLSSCPPPPPRAAAELLAWGMRWGVTSLLCGPAARPSDDGSCAAAVLRGAPRSTGLVVEQAGLTGLAALPWPLPPRPAVDERLRDAATALARLQRVPVPRTHWVPRATLVQEGGDVWIEVPCEDEVFVFVMRDGAIEFDEDDVAARADGPGPLSPADLPPFLALMESVAVQAVLDLLAWPQPHERTLLMHALEPPWRAVVDAMAARAAPAAASPLRTAFEIVPGTGVCGRVQRRRADGTWSAGDRVALGTLAARDDIADDERALARLLAGGVGGFATAPWSDGALRALVGHPLVLLDDAPVRVETATASLRCRPRGDGGIVVDVCVCGAPVPRELVAAWGLGPALVVRDDVVLLVELGPGLRPVLAAVARLPATGIAPDGALSWLDAVAAAARAAGIPVDVDPACAAALHGARVDPVVRPTLRLRPRHDRIGAIVHVVLDVEVVVRPLPGAAACVPGQGAPFLVCSRVDGRVHCVRDLDGERAQARAVITSLRAWLDERAGGDGGTTFTVAPTGRASSFVAALEGRDDLDVEWPAGRPWRVVTATTRALRVRAWGSPTCLHLCGHVNVDGASLELTRLLEAARDGRDWIAFDDDTVVLLSETLRDHAAALAAVTSIPPVGVAGEEGAQIPGERIEGGIAAALALVSLAEDGALVVDDDTRAQDGTVRVADRWRARVEAARRVDDVPPPALVATLRPYQRAGLLFLRRLAALGTGGVLADDMGLGKTLQAIALLVDRAALGPQLVIAPLSLLANWRAELARFAPSLHVVDASPREGVDASMWRAGDVVVVSYGVAVLHAGALAARSCATLIIDEAQAVKNADSQRARAVRGLSADVRVALTGTPLENHTGELWSIVSTVAPGLLPPWPRFRAQFQVPIERGADGVARAALRARLAPVFLRRDKRAVAPELPPRTDVVVDVELSSVERARYDALRRTLGAHVRRKDAPDAQRRIIVLSALQRLRQFACDPALDDTCRDLSTTTSSKLATLLRLVQGAARTGQRSLVFSQFTRLLDRVGPLLSRAGLSFVRLDGATPPAARTAAVTTFQNGAVDVFLLSLKAGGVGLNLTAADHVVLLDPWWNPAVESQATDRAHRIGQTRPVTVHRLVARDTIEEAVQQMQDHKRALFTSLLDEGAASERIGDIDALLALLDSADPAG